MATMTIGTISTIITMVGVEPMDITLTIQAIMDTMAIITATTMLTTIPTIIPTTIIIVIILTTTQEDLTITMMAKVITEEPTLLTQTNLTQMVIPTDH